MLIVENITQKLSGWIEVLSLIIPIFTTILTVGLTAGVTWWIAKKEYRDRQLGLERKANIAMQLTKNSLDGLNFEGSAHQFARQIVNFSYLPVLPLNNYLENYQELKAFNSYQEILDMKNLMDLCNRSIESIHSKSEKEWTIQEVEALRKNLRYLGGHLIDLEID